HPDIALIRGQNNCSAALASINCNSNVTLVTAHFLLFPFIELLERLATS
ncbi:4267_t:CDS:2, partial [Diversispora eburnea]